MAVVSCQANVKIQHKAFSTSEVTAPTAATVYSALGVQGHWPKCELHHCERLSSRPAATTADRMQTATLHPDVRLTPDPVSTPEKFRSAPCHLELTPVWQYVIKKNRFPTNVDRQEVLAELAVRLQHPEWQVSSGVFKRGES